MHYCKKCGRQLKEGARFCDRCGQSVKQSRNSSSEKKQKQIEKLQRERLERKKRQEQLDEIERKRNERKREKRQKQNKIFFCIIACIAVTAIVAVIAFAVTTISSKNEPWKNNTPIGGLSTDSVSTMAPSVTAEPSAHPESAEKDKYSVYELSNGSRFSYPNSFTEEDIEDDEELHFTDKSGAEIRVYLIEYPSGTASALMKEYADNEIGKVVTSSAEDNHYSITLKDDDIVKHRKYLIDRDNDVCVYYDFEYDETLVRTADYESYTEYMDENFTLPKNNKADDEGK